MNLKLKEVLLKYDIPITENNVSRLCEFAGLMLDYNQTHNLTAITEKDDIIYKHLLDSLLPLDHLKDNTHILDIGCGAGFPSVPLAISNVNLNISAIDSVRKKTDFIALVKDKLNINNINVMHTRIEDIAGNSSYRENFDIVTSRAVAPLNIILEYSAPMLKNGGYIFAYKGANYQEEIDNATNALKVLDCKVEEIYEYPISEINATRYILKIRKNSDIPIKYPRKQNKPRLQPLWNTKAVIQNNTKNKQQTKYFIRGKLWEK